MEDDSEEETYITDAILKKRSWKQTRLVQYNSSLKKSNHKKEIQYFQQTTKSLIEPYNLILQKLDSEQKSDLGLHLFSFYLLKKLIGRANDKRFPYPSAHYIYTVLPDRLISWPSRNVVLDPQIDKTYEEIPESLERDLEWKETREMELTNGILSEWSSEFDNDIGSDIEPGEVSERALKHAANMMKMELDSLWQRKLITSSKRAKINLDVDLMPIPNELSTHILEKLDNLFDGLHLKVAQQNEITLKEEGEYLDSEEEYDISEGRDRNSEVEEGNDIMATPDHDIENTSNTINNESDEEVFEEEQGEEEEEDEQEEEDYADNRKVGDDEGNGTDEEEDQNDKNEKEKASSIQNNRKQSNSPVTTNTNARISDKNALFSLVKESGAISEQYRIRISYHEILDCLFDMDEDMKDIYMKCLKLYNDIPETFRKHDYKLPIKVMREHRFTLGSRKSFHEGDASKRSFRPLEFYLQHAHVPQLRGFLLMLTQRKEQRNSSEVKTFLQVQENYRRLYTKESVEFESACVIDDRADETRDKYQKLLGEMKPYLSEEHDTSPDNYNASDCLVPIPRSNMRKIKETFLPD